MGFGGKKIAYFVKGMVVDVDNVNGVVSDPPL